MRSRNSSRERPGDNFKWNDSDFLKPTLEQGEKTWLGKQWSRRNDRLGSFPSINEIIRGV